MNDAIIFATPLFLIGMSALLIRVRRLSLTDDVGIRPFAMRDLLLWGGAFAALAVASELIARALGLNDPAGAWIGKYDAFRLALRIAAVGLIYPIAEELFFRGALLGAIRRRFGDWQGISASALLFALVHIQYDWRGMALVLVDALFYAVCRIRARSLYLTILLHVAGNSFAIWQRLHA